MSKYEHDGDDFEEYGIYDDTQADVFEEHPMLHQKQGQVASLNSDLFAWFENMVITLTVFTIFSIFLFSFTRVSGASMEPTLNDGEILLLWSGGYSPEVGDIVIVNNPTIEYLEGSSIVKRVIALGGDLVEIDYGANTVAVNGIPVIEDYILEKMRPIYGEEVSEFLVPEGSVFVLGDNRNHSADSRYYEISYVDEGYILGVVKAGVFPLSSIRWIDG